ncbi:primary active transporter [Lithospermum erythrorhizon]|uniref:Primary active transporter n=1 Tax=Lithospermum erythrorhizon TaxID=34254 RepID=A0AAV3RZG5_LITER
MPSRKSKKSSKPPSKYSSPSNNSSNIDEEFNEQDHKKAIKEASKKFPNLICETALIGIVFDSAISPSFVAADYKESNKIFLSEAALDSAKIAPGSVVSVSLASSANFISSFPLSSLAIECAKSFEFGYSEDCSDEPGSYFTIATVFPSIKVSKNAVRLSSNLSCTLGFPQTGRTVFVYPLQSHSITGVANGNNKLNASIAGPHSSIECKELCLTLVPTKGKFPKRSRYSRIDSSVETDVQSDNELMSSPRTPISRSKLSSSNSFRLSATGMTESTAETPDLHGSSKGLDIEHVLKDAASKKVVQTCVASWLYSRSLLSGNFVVVPILSSLVVFLVRNVNGVSANTSNLADKDKPLTVSRGTTVLISPSKDYESLISDRRLNADNGIDHGYTEANSVVEFSSFGGLSEEFAVLKDIIITSTMKGTLASMGIRPTKGVLLHGPPGTGKTSLARLCAQDAGVNLFSVNGPEIVSQYQGESEKALHEIFDSASQAAPAVVFIDELDAIAPARKDGGEELSQRMVATLLNVMDGISKTDGVLVIAATNRPDSIEPALRRPGRLDREIEIGVPSPKQRFEILNAHILKMEHSLSLTDIQNIATTTHGFVGADLAALCNESALVCLRRYVGSGDPAAPDSQSSTELSGSSEHESNSCPVIENGCSLEHASSSISEVNTSSYANNGIEVDVTSREECKNLKIDFEDFEKARLRVRPSAMREVILEVPKVRWEDVGGQREVKMQLMEAVEWPQKHQDAFKRIGTRPPSGILLFGPPGCSKTLLARAVASESGLNFLAVKGPELFSKWVGESEKAVRSLFAKARANSPSIIFFDEIDGLAVIRGKESDGVSVSDRVMSQLLVELDGLHERLNVTVIAATNRPDKIDQALLRPGRFDRLLYVGPPNVEDREDIFRVHLRRMPYSSNVSTKELALLTDGFTGADISLVCREAAMAAIDESLDASEIAMKHLKAGIKQVQPSELQSYQNLSKKFQRLVKSTAEDDQSNQLQPVISSQSPQWIKSVTRFLFG